MNPYTALLFASIGNVLAIVLNYLLGYFFYEKMHTKLESSVVGKKSLLLGHKYGYAFLPLTWLPIVGDPLTIVAGVLRLNFFWFFVVAGGLRIGRYTLLMLGFQ
jgi:membrane protein YqaA with SNARE-associated domain